MQSRTLQSRISSVGLSAMLDQAFLTLDAVDVILTHTPYSEAIRFQAGAFASGQSVGSIIEIVGSDPTRAMAHPDNRKLLTKISRHFRNNLFNRIIRPDSSLLETFLDIIRQAYISCMDNARRLGGCLTHQAATALAFMTSQFIMLK